MGSGNSRLNSTEGETLPTKIRYTLIRRFEEFRKRRNAAPTLSKKQLLKDVEEEDGGSNISQSSSREINETEDCKVSVWTKEETKVPLTTTEKISRVVPIENSECETIEKKEEKVDINKDVDQNKEKVIDEKGKVEVDIKTEEGNIEGIVEEVKEHIEEVKEENEQKVCEKSGENDDNDSGDDDDEEEEEEEDLGRFICPGSPSFRIYCTEADKRKEEEVEESKIPIIVMHQKSRSADSVQSAASRNTRVTKEVREIVESGSITKRKSNKTKKFGAVRTLLKVKSCYHPMCTCTGDNRSRLIVAKAAN